MTLCSTLEQRWRACRSPVYRTGFDWLRVNKPCQLVSEWGALGLRLDRWPCTSPRRHHCRAGEIRPGFNWDAENALGSVMCSGPCARRRAPKASHAG